MTDFWYFPSLGDPSARGFEVFLIASQFFIEVNSEQHPPQPYPPFARCLIAYARWEVFSSGVCVNQITEINKTDTNENEKVPLIVV